MNSVKTKIATMALLIQIVKIVIELRKAQKAWFKDHRQNDLVRSKQLERQVDLMLDGLVLPDEPKQLQLNN